MPKTVVGGTVQRQDQPLATPVDNIFFPNVDANATAHVGALGTMILSSFPIPEENIGHYDVGNILRYENSNRHNDYTLQVTRNDGPKKYEIQVTQTAF